MIGINKHYKNVALSFMLAGGLSGFATVAQAHHRSQGDIRSAQQELKAAGYYKGDVDGIDGAATHAAIRNYQRDKNLAVTGRLDEKTRKDLRVSTRDEDVRRSEANRNAREADRITREADRSAGEADRIQSTALVPSSATVSAAQRRLARKGFYKGEFDGRLGPETQSAIREYQKNSNLNVTGKIDRATLSSLGVSK